MGVVKNVSDVELSELVNTTSVDLVLSDLLSRRNGGTPMFQTGLSVFNKAERLYNNHIIVAYT